MSATLNWGIVGTGRIAGIFARALARSRTGRLAAVGSRDAARASAFAAGFPGAAAHGSYEALLADPAVQAVYLATPHPEHAAWVVRAAEAGKAVLCEKPLTLNHPEAMVAIAAARARGVLLMEGFMYRFHPQTARILELVRGGALGKIGLVQASFGFAAAYAPGHRKWADRFGGGAILDVGCYPVSLARLVAGAARAAGAAEAEGGAWPFADPVEVNGAGLLHPDEGTDTYAAATLRFAGGIVAQVACGIGLQQDNSARIYGSAGWLHVPAPWILHRDGGPSSLFLHRPGAAAPEEIAIECPDAVYALEADAFAAAAARGALEVPEMPLADSLGNMAALDAWRAALGLVYQVERPENAGQTVARRPLAWRSAGAIPQVAVAGIGPAVSRLVLGVDYQRTMPQAAALFDAFFERGGNAFDTAHIYGGGTMEPLLGHWLRHRGVRGEAVVIGKGAHTPWCTPEHLTRQLHESLDRLQTGYVDLYLVHRDNPAVPVSEFVDVLNEEARAGRIRVFGASNWSIKRLAAANRYAARKGLQGFAALSNQFSLARMVAPQWSGALSSGDARSRQWLRKTQLPLFAWSSQARGLFADRTGRPLAPEVARCWEAEDNTARLERVRALAGKKGVAPASLALAHVLHQPFPTFALIGPRTIDQLDGSMEAVGLELTPRETAWLNLERSRPD